MKSQAMRLSRAKEKELHKRRKYEQGARVPVHATATVNGQSRGPRRHDSKRDRTTRTQRAVLATKQGRSKMKPFGPVNIGDIVALQDAVDRIDANDVWRYPHGDRKEIDRQRAQFRNDRQAVAQLSSKIRQQMTHPAPRRGYYSAVSAKETSR